MFAGHARSSPSGSGSFASPSWAPTKGGAENDATTLTRTIRAGRPRRRRAVHLSDMVGRWRLVRRTTGGNPRRPKFQLKARPEAQLNAPPCCYHPGWPSLEVMMMSRMKGACVFWPNEHVPREGDLGDLMWDCHLSTPANEGRYPRARPTEPEDMMRKGNA